VPCLSCLCNEILEDPMVPVAMGSQTDHEQAAEGLLRCLSETEQLFPPAGLSDLLVARPTASRQSWPRGEDSSSQALQHIPVAES